MLSFYLLPTYRRSETGLEKIRKIIPLGSYIAGNLTNDTHYTPIKIAMLVGTAVP